VKNLLKEIINVFKKMPCSIWIIVSIFFISRIILGGIGIIIHEYPSLVCSNCSVPNFGYSTRNIWIEVWGKWDTSEYLDIARYGYSPEIRQGGTEQAVNYVFFPLYPILINIFSIGARLDVFWIAWLISNLSLIASSFTLYKLAKFDFGEGYSLKIVKYLYLLPVSFLFSAILSESLFLFLLLSSFYFARQKKWFLSGLFGFFLSLTRPLGVVIIIPLIVEYLLSINFNLVKIKSDIGFLLLPILGIIPFAIFNRYLTGDFLGFVHMQSLWGNHLSNPISILISNLIYGWKTPAFYSLILIVLLFYSLKKIRLSYWVLFLLLFFIPLSTGLFSILRYTVVIFPLCFILAKIGSSDAMDRILTILLIVLQVYLFIAWQTGSPLVI